MVAIPLPVQQGQPVGSVKTDAANTPFMNVRPGDTTSALSNDLDKMGAALQQGARILTDRRKDVNLMAAEKEIFDWERGLLDPTTGLATQKGGNAAGITDRTSASFTQLRENLMAKYGGGIGHSGKMALEELLNGTERRIWKSTAGYETGELDAEAARISAGAVDNLEELTAKRLYYGDTDGASAAMLQLEGRLEDEADRQGYTNEARKEFIENGKSKAWTNAIALMADSGKEIEAEAMLKELMADDKIDQTSAINLLNKISPLAQEKRDKIAAGEAIAEVNAPFGSTAMGQPTVDSIMPSLIMQESGYGPQFGSARTLEEATTIKSPVGATGLTQIMPGTMKAPGMGVTPYRFANGVPPGTPPAEVAQEQMRFGKDYLNALVHKYNGNMELALYAYNWGAGNVDAWRKTGLGKNGQPMPSETSNYARAILSRAGYTTREVGPGGQNTTVADTLTPRERLARDHGQGAVDQFDKLVEKDYTMRNRAQTELYSTAVSEVDRLFAESGNVDLDQLFAENPGLRDQLGDKIIPLRAYVEKRNKKEDIVTDPATYGALATMRETDPDLFQRTDLLQFVDRLDPTTLKGLQEDQAEMLGKYKKGDERVTRADVENAVGDLISASITGSDRTQRMDEAKFAVRDWAHSIYEQTGKPPTALQMLAFTEQLLLSKDGVKLNMKGSEDWFATKATGYEDAVEAIEGMGMQDMLADPAPLNLTLPSAAGPIEVTIKQADRQKVYEDLLLALGRAPDAGDMMTALTLKYSDVFNP